jgi:hypothetical protein
MMGWLVRQEAFPTLFHGRPTGYRPVMQDGVLTLDSWMRILYQGQPLGYSHTGILTCEDDPKGYYTVNNTLNLKLNIMGTAQRIHVDTQAVLDSLYKLNRFSFRLQSGDYVMETTGERHRGDTFQVHVRTANSEQQFTVKIPPDVVIYSPMTEMAVAQLAPGESLQVQTFDPTTLSVDSLIVEALRRESIVIAEREHKAIVVATDYHGMRIHSWLDQNGLMLRQETPFGWIMERCTIEEAFNALRDADAAVDVLQRLAVRCYGTIPNPRQATILRLALSGCTFERKDLQSARQEVVRLDETGAELLVRSQPLSLAAGAPLSREDAAKYLAASRALQSDHPDIRSCALRLTRDAASPEDKAAAIFDWVFKNVRKKPTVSIPSAVDVLKTLEGDCNEHTYLFVALARAAGIPASVRVGIAYAHGAFYYHAWPAVYLGEWIEMDPTWGQKRVDATHIALLEGELVDQLSLLKMIGNLEVRILQTGTIREGGIAP